MRCLLRSVSDLFWRFVAWCSEPTEQPRGITIFLWVYVVIGFARWFERELRIDGALSIVNFVIWLVIWALIFELIERHKE